MSTYGIKRAYQDVVMTQPIAENPCVAFFSPNVAQRLSRSRRPGGGVAGAIVYPTKCICLADTGYGTQRWAGLNQEPERQLRRSLLLINR